MRHLKIQHFSTQHSQRPSKLHPGTMISFPPQIWQAANRLVQINYMLMQRRKSRLSNFFWYYHSIYIIFGQKQKKKQEAEHPVRHNKYPEVESYRASRTDLSPAVARVDNSEDKNERDANSSSDCVAVADKIMCLNEHFTSQFCWMNKSYLFYIIVVISRLQ